MNVDIGAGAAQETRMSDIERPPVWVIFTGNYLTDVIAEHEDGDTLATEEAVEYVPASKLAVAVDQITKMERTWAPPEQLVALAREIKRLADENDALRT